MKKWIVILMVLVIPMVAIGSEIELNEKLYDAISDRNFYLEQNDIAYNIYFGDKIPNSYVGMVLVSYIEFNEHETVMKTITYYYNIKNGVINAAGLRFIVGINENLYLLPDTPTVLEWIGNE